MGPRKQRRGKRRKRYQVSGDESQHELRTWEMGDEEDYDVVRRLTKCPGLLCTSGRRWAAVGKIGRHREVPAQRGKANGNQRSGKEQAELGHRDQGTLTSRCLRCTHVA